MTTETKKTETKKTETKKISKKISVIILSSAAVFALLVILVTCSLFDEESVTATPDWKTLVKNSSWTYSSKNVNDSTKLIPALQTVKSVTIGSDYLMTIEYLDDKGTSYYFTAGNLTFDNNSKANVTVSQPSSEGYKTNIITLTYSDQSSKQYDSNNYVMTMSVQDIGSLYFFAN